MTPNDRIPEEIPPQSTARGIAVSLGLAVAIVVALNAAMAVHLGANEIDLVTSKWNRLAQHSGEVDWLFMGDSSCNQGLDPEVWARDGGGTALNLCTVAYVTVANSPWMLHEWTKRHGPPKRGVVMVHTFDTWPREFETSQLVSYPFDWGFWTTFQPPLNPSWQEQRDLLLLRYIPMMSRSGRLTNLENLRFEAEDANRERALNPGTFVRTDGFMPWNHPDPNRLAEDTRDVEEFFATEKFEISELNRAALDVVARWADEHQVPVYLVNAPLYDVVERLGDQRAYRTKIDAALSDFASKHSSITYVPGVFTADADHLTSVDHITADTAVDYTKWVAERVVPAK